MVRPKILVVHHSRTGTAAKLADAMEAETAAAATASS